jgi:hypothetical protein
MSGLLHFIVEPGLLSSGPVRTAVLVGTVVAVTSGVVGVLTVIRGQSFAGHSLADVATTGGAGAFLVGVSQFWGFLIVGIAGAALMELIGVQRRRGRDVATGVVLGAALGAAALFLYLGTLTSSTTGAHRRGAVDGAADRAGRHVAAGHQAPGAGDGRRGADRHRRHLAGHPAGLRQLLLDVRWPRLAS